MMGIVVPETYWASNKIYNKKNLFHLVGIFPHINNDAGSKSFQILLSWFQTFTMFWMLCSFFWVISRRLSFLCRHFGTLVYSIFIGGVSCLHCSAQHLITLIVGTASLENLKTNIAWFIASRYWITNWYGKIWTASKILKLWFRSFTGNGRSLEVPAPSIFREEML